ncbi:nickel-dependent hydrogenase large subunit [Granulosicoccaceae sp. 1_MG-2023]|nr:nickel-dependent hydrogenase large subunit [Granulosicoccaceae sp. 1_MG-2023]
MNSNTGGDISGSLHIAVLPSAEQFQTRIGSSRPLLASRVFEGKTINQVLHLVPLLYNVCGQAQSVAAVRAIENATGREAAPEIERRRELLLALEGIREHLWRFFIDWPKLLGHSTEAAHFAPLNRALMQLSATLNPDKRLTTTPGLQGDDDGGTREAFAGHWHSLREDLLLQVFADTGIDATATQLPAGSAAAQLLDDVLAKGYAGLGDIALAPLPELPDEEVTALLRGDEADQFVAYPQWQGSSYETGPFARQATQPLSQALITQHGLGVLPRMASRLTELLQMVQTIDAWLAGASLFRARTPEKAFGLAQLEAARGRLIHYVETDDDRILRYRIVAPTEWNFHPQGILARMLDALPQQASASLREKAELLISLADPCVGYSLTIHEQDTGPGAHA